MRGVEQVATLLDGYLLAATLFMNRLLISWSPPLQEWPQTRVYQCSTKETFLSVLCIDPPFLLAVLTTDEVEGTISGLSTHMLKSIQSTKVMAAEGCLNTQSSKGSGLKRTTLDGIVVNLILLIAGNSWNTCLGRTRLALQEDEEIRAISAQKGEVYLCTTRHLYHHTIVDVYHSPRLIRQEVVPHYLQARPPTLTREQLRVITDSDLHRPDAGLSFLLFGPSLYVQRTTGTVTTCFNSSLQSSELGQILDGTTILNVYDISFEDGLTFACTLALSSGELYSIEHRNGSSLLKRIAVALTLDENSPKQLYTHCIRYRSTSDFLFLHARQKTCALIRADNGDPITLVRNVPSPCGMPESLAPVIQLAIWEADACILVTYIQGTSLGASLLRWHGDGPEYSCKSLYPSDSATPYLQSQEVFDFAAYAQELLQGAVSVLTSSFHRFRFVVVCRHPIVRTAFQPVILTYKEEERDCSCEELHGFCVYTLPLIPATKILLLDREHLLSLHATRDLLTFCSAACLNRPQLDVYESTTHIVMSTDLVTGEQRWHGISLPTNTELRHVVVSSITAEDEVRLELSFLLSMVVTEPFSLYLYRAILPSYTSQQFYTSETNLTGIAYSNIGLTLAEPHTNGSYLLYAQGGFLLELYHDPSNGLPTYQVVSQGMIREHVLGVKILHHNPEDVTRTLHCKDTAAVQYLDGRKGKGRSHDSLNGVRDRYFYCLLTLGLSTEDTYVPTPVLWQLDNHVQLSSEGSLWAFKMALISSETHELVRTRTLHHISARDDSNVLQTFLQGYRFGIFNTSLQNLLTTWVIVLACPTDVWVFRAYDCCLLSHTSLHGEQIVGLGVIPLGCGLVVVVGGERVHLLPV
ncbi:hypothetical protein GMRT_12423 [Giardia muris]|uniref:Uncharacterized protein n=1 Tax=Giardia muris TaxID=5742 RepID=A0A4Z1T3V4_GIAMU|nr:hypothetical protein GMRT_12423 [Giardia muris]|eukprot:TNJ27219.1 hypothetical protein GMRT_12423 [Giardia muris]